MNTVEFRGVAQRQSSGLQNRRLRVRIASPLPKKERSSCFVLFFVQGRHQFAHGWRNRHRVTRLTIKDCSNRYSVAKLNLSKNIKFSPLLLTNRVSPARKKHTFVYQDNVCFFQRNSPPASEIWLRHVKQLRCEIFASQM